jgi:hypothetical protein
MTSHRLTIAGASVALALASALPATAALAGPLLSGYGGPGAGNQALLGSALLNGPSGGAGSGGEGASEGGAGSYGGDATLAVAGGEGTAPAGNAARGTTRGGGKQRERATGRASAGGARPRAATSALTSSREQTGSVRAPVLSGANLLYVLLALGALVVTGAFTRRLTRQPG